MHAHIQRYGTSSAVNTMEPTMVAPMQMTATGPNSGLSIVTTARLFCSTQTLR